jgi:hypothetical protein
MMPQGTTDDDQPDLVDEHFRPFVRALGNLVITFALCEAGLLELVSEMLGGDELKAVTVLKAKDAKDQVLSLVCSLGLSGFDLEDLVAGLDKFWIDKATRNRLVHDEWYPSFLEDEDAGLQIGDIGIRGLTRAKKPEVVFGTVDNADIWRLALRFRDYDSLFSHRSYCIRQHRDAQSGD